MNLSSAPALDEKDRHILQHIDESLADALELRRWWLEKETTQNYNKKFEIVRTFHRPNSGFGFFDVPSLRGKPAPVMGETHQLLFDRADDHAPEAITDIRKQLQEFVLRYLTHVSDFREPEVYAETTGKSLNRIDNPLSWVPTEAPNWEGFGYAQQYYKLQGTNTIGKFPEDQQYAVVDLRELQTVYEWIVIKVQIFNFVLTFRPFGAAWPDIQIPLQEETYVIFHRDFVSNRVATGTNEKIQGEYGFGYGLLRVDDNESLLAYGPGHFDYGFKSFDFQLLSSGETNVKMGFVANRPERVLQVPLNPVDWSFALADALSLGSASKLFGSFKNTLKGILPSFGSFDPLYGYVSLANALTAGLAAKKLDISRERLEKTMLVQHFQQHNQMMTSSLLTWRYIENWLDRASLPAWVIEGKNAVPAAAG